MDVECEKESGMPRGFDQSEQYNCQFPKQKRLREDQVLESRARQFSCGSVKLEGRHPGGRKAGSWTS